MPKPWAVLAALFTLFLVLLPDFPLIRAIPDGDTGAFLYVGRKILEGQRLYQDLWDPQQPGIYYVHAFGLLLGGKSGLGVWVLEYVALAVAFIFGYKVINAAFGVIPALCGSIAWLLALPFLRTEANVPETFGLPILFGLFYMLTKPTVRLPLCTFFLLGLFTSMLLLLKANLLSGPASVFLAFMLPQLQTRNWRWILTRTTAAGAGFLSLLLVVGSFLALSGTLTDYLIATTTQASLFNVPTLVDRVKPFIAGLVMVGSSGPIALGLAGCIAGVLYCSHSQKRPPPPLLAALLAILFWLAVSAASGLWFHSYHFIPWLPALAILVGFFTHFISAEMRGSMIGVPVVLLSLLLSLSLVSFYRIYSNLRDISKANSLGVVVKYINAQTSPYDSVLVWGDGAAINFASGRDIPTRFVTESQLFRGKGTEHLLEELVSDIGTSKPALIIDAGGVPLDPAQRQQWLESYQGAPRLLKGKEVQMNRLSEYLLSHYRLAGTIGPMQWRVYRYVGDNLSMAEPGAARWPP